MRYNNIFFI